MLGGAVLIATPKDKKLEQESAFVTEKTKNKRFFLEEPAYCWEYPRNVTLLPDPNMWCSWLVQNYLTVCTDTELEDLLKPMTNYLRFITFQDTKEGSPYIYGLLRAIDDCAYQSHKDVLYACPCEMVPVEVNLATYGIFIFVDRPACMARTVGPEDVRLIDA